MEKIKIKICEDVSQDIAKAVGSVMPMGHIGVCFLSGDSDIAHKAMSAIGEFEYKITYIEYPDGSVADEFTVGDVVNAPDDIRLFIGVGGRDVATILGDACAKRNTPYLLATYSPFIYGVGYCVKAAVLPIEVYVDAGAYSARDDYAHCVGAAIAHRVALWERKYVYQMLGKYDYSNIKREQDLLDGMIGDGEMADKARILEGFVEYAKVADDTFLSCADILSQLIERCMLTRVRGESMLIAAIALVKYFKAIMSIEESRLLIPADISSHCRVLAKMTDIDISEIMKAVTDRKFQGKWLYIHSEYREDMLKELNTIDAKLLKIIKSAKRFMGDVGYHLGEDYDSNVILTLLRHLSPLAHECSPAAMADYLGMVSDQIQ